METNTENIELGYALEHVSSVLVKQLDQILLEQLGIGYAQFKILRVLAEHAHIGQRQIADELAQTEASISRQVKLLQEEGFITTKVDSANRRQHLSRLTRKGFRFVRAAEEITERYQRNIFEPLKPKEQSLLQKTLARIHEQAHTSEAHLPKSYNDLLHQL